MAIPDSELVARAQKGDLRAFDELIARHQRRVYILAYRIMGNAEDASDIGQDTFVRAWKSLKRFKGNSAFGTWLHRICVNMCLTKKRRKSYSEIPVDFDDERHRSSSGGTVTCIEKKETALFVHKVLAQMPANYRTLIVLRELEDRPFEEIAEIMGCSVASVRTKLYRARNIMRDKIRPMLYGDDVK